MGRSGGIHGRRWDHHAAKTMPRRTTRPFLYVFAYVKRLFSLL